MKVYSHSRLSCYEQCPQKYKLKYIDKIETEVEENIESYLGIRVHEALEKLYRDLKFEKFNSLEEILDFFRNEWKENWNDSIIIVKDGYSPANYLKMGERFLTDYYKKYAPFDQERTISLEERIMINLDDKSEYKLQGYIDRVAESKEGYYEVHDYKTNSRLPLPEYIENDRQLALYAIGIKEKYPDVKDVKLIWHFLAFNKEIDSTRTDEELKDLKYKVIKLIDKIESDERFLAKVSILCDWCEFKPICREWSHLYVLKEKPRNEYLSDSGLKLVDCYAKLKRKQKQVTLDLYAELEKLEEAIILFAKKEGIDVVFGSKNKIRVKEFIQNKFPAKNSKERIELENLLKKYGKLDEVMQLDTSALNKIISDKKWDNTIIEILKKYLKVEKSKRLYISKIKKEE